MVEQRSRLAVVTILGLVAAACGGPAGFECDSATACHAGAGGACEADNLCSHPAADCPSGRRYDEHAGSSSGACVGAGPGVDAAPVDSTTGGGCAVVDPFNNLEGWTSSDGEACSVGVVDGQLRLESDGSSCTEDIDALLAYRWDAYSFEIELADPGLGLAVFFEVIEMNGGFRSVEVRRVADTLRLAVCVDNDCTVEVVTTPFVAADHYRWRLAATPAGRFELTTEDEAGTQVTAIGSVDAPYFRGASAHVRIGTDDVVGAGPADVAAFDNLRICDH